MSLQICLHLHVNGYETLFISKLVTLGCKGAHYRKIFRY